MELKPYFTTRSEASKQLGVSLYHIDKLIKLGELESVNIGTSVRIKIESIERWIEKEKTSYRENQ